MIMMMSQNNVERERLVKNNILQISSETALPVQECVQFYQRRTILTKTESLQPAPSWGVKWWWFWSADRLGPTHLAGLRKCLTGRCASLTRCFTFPKASWLFRASAHKVLYLATASKLFKASLLFRASAHQVLNTLPQNSPLEIQKWCWVWPCDNCCQVSESQSCQACKLPFNMFVLVRSSPLPTPHISSHIPSHHISPHIYHISPHSPHIYPQCHHISPFHQHPHPPQPLIPQLDFNHVSVFPICICIHSFVLITKFWRR